MTETDITKRPLQMPEKFLPYLEKYRIYRIFKDMVKDLVVNLPKDHLKHMKIYLTRHAHSCKEPDRIILLAEPGLYIDIKAVAKQLIKDLGLFVITRRCVMDRYEKHDKYVSGCVSPPLMSEVTKSLTIPDPVAQAGWLMFDHPCTVREARCLQQDGVLPNVTLVLMAAPPIASAATDNHTSSRNFFQQDYEGLKFAYKATLKEVHLNANDDVGSVADKCINAVTAMAAGAQGPGQGAQVVGNPGTYRVLIIGPRGSGRRTQALLLASQFGLVYLYFNDMIAEAKERNDDLGERIRNYGTSIQIRQEVVKQRLMQKDCLDNGWVMVGYPTSGHDFERFDNTTIPPNRIIFLNVDINACRQRLQQCGVDWCTGKRELYGSGPRVMRHPLYDEQALENEWDTYFSETLAELRAAAGVTAVEIDATPSIEQVQVKIQAAVIAAPAFTIELPSQLRNVCAD